MERSHDEASGDQIMTHNVGLLEDGYELKLEDLWWNVCHASQPVT